MTISIHDRLIGDGFPPFIIAEMSGNHNHSLERALALVDAAAEAGADAIKLQTYTADSITMDVDSPEFIINDECSNWDGRSLHSLYTEAHTPRGWHEKIFSHAKQKGLLCFSSPFDEESVDFLEELKVPAYKIASFENNHLPLIRKAASTGKPVIISTGMASLGDLELAVNAVRAEGNDNIILLKCTSTYPASPENTNISTIPHMKQLFGCEVGLSDHTMGVGVSVGAVALGACLVEKHLTLKRSDGGIDSSFSLEAHEFKTLVSECNRTWLALGQVRYGPTNAETKSSELRRSIYIARDIAVGDTFTLSNLKIIRPGKGAPPALLEEILGLRAKRTFKRGSPLLLEDLLRE